MVPVALSDSELAVISPSVSASAAWLIVRLPVLLMLPPVWLKALVTETVPDPLSTPSVILKVLMLLAPFSVSIPAPDFVMEPSVLWLVCNGELIVRLSLALGVLIAKTLLPTPPMLMALKLPEPTNTEAAPVAVSVPANWSAGKGLLFPPLSRTVPPFRVVFHRVLK